MSPVHHSSQLDNFSIDSLMSNSEIIESQDLSSLSGDLELVLQDNVFSDNASTSGEDSMPESVENQEENAGRWTSDEHDLFLQGLRLYGKGWKKIAQLIRTRTVIQVRTHAQKYFLKMAKAKQNGIAGEVTMDGSISYLPVSKKPRVPKSSDKRSSKKSKYAKAASNFIKSNCGSETTVCPLTIGISALYDNPKLKLDEGPSCISPLSVTEVPSDTTLRSDLPQATNSFAQSKGTSFPSNVFTPLQPALVPPPQSRTAVVQDHDLLLYSSKCDQANDSSTDISFDVFCNLSTLADVQSQWELRNSNNNNNVLIPNAISINEKKRCRPPQQDEDSLSICMQENAVMSQASNSNGSISASLISDQLYHDSLLLSMGMNNITSSSISQDQLVSEAANSSFSFGFEFGDVTEIDENELDDDLFTQDVYALNGGLSFISS